MDTLDVPTNPPPLPKKPVRPKITLQIPDIAAMPAISRGPVTATSIYYNPRYHGKQPATPGSHISDPNFNPFMNMYHNKASEFMFKQFEGFKDFTMNTAKSGLSAGEKSAFWFYNKLKLLSRRWFTHLFLTLCLFLYSLMGAAVFMTLEGPSEKDCDKNLTDIRMGVANMMRDIFVKNTSLLYDRNYNLYPHIEAYMVDYEVTYMDIMKHVNDNNTTKTTWTFWNAMFYSGTIYTTIGYGHIAPKTTAGRVATIVYATIGIPLFLILLADFGKLFTRIIKFFWAFIRRFYFTRSCRKVRNTGPVQEVMKGLNIVYDVVRRPSQIFLEEDIEGNIVVSQPPPIERKGSDVPPPLPPRLGVVKDHENVTEPDTPAPSLYQIDDEFNLPISVAVIILLIYINIGAVAYSMWERWNFFESFYFIFISISTIGLGDLVPDHPMFMMASILYLVFGFALTSMCINVVQVKLANTFKQASAKLGATIGLKISEEDGSIVPITPQPIEDVPVHKPKAEADESKSKEVNESDTKNK